MGIYTKKGDAGFTTNLLGDAFRKDHAMINLQGSIDEINASMGYLRSLLKEESFCGSEEKGKEVDDLLKGIQYVLFRIGSDVAAKFTTVYVTNEEISILEKGIDQMTEKTGALKHFIYYNGTKSSTYCQVLRSVVRRGERAFVAALSELGWQDTYPLDYQYINRLSDYCFTMARYLNHICGVDDEIMTI